MHPSVNILSNVNNRYQCKHLSKKGKIFTLQGGSVCLAAKPWAMDTKIKIQHERLWKLILVLKFALHISVVAF